MSPERPSKRSRSNKSDDAARYATVPNAEYGVIYPEYGNTFTEHESIQRTIRNLEQWTAKRKADAALLERQSREIKDDACATSLMGNEGVEQRFGTALDSGKGEEERGEEERREGVQGGGGEEGKKAQHQTALEALNPREDQLGWQSKNRTHSTDGGDSMECDAAFELGKKRKRVDS